MQSALQRVDMHTTLQIHFCFAARSESTCGKLGVRTGRVSVFAKTSAADGDPHPQLGKECDFGMLAFDDLHNIGGGIQLVLQIPVGKYLYCRPS